MAAQGTGWKRYPANGLFTAELRPQLFRSSAIIHPQSPAKLDPRSEGIPVASHLRSLAHELIVFGCKELAACVFAGSFLLVLALSRHMTPPGMWRYDFLFVAAISIQAL